MSLISVVIPVHNTAKYLRKCIDSVLSQTLHDMEVILVENCSTDGSYQLCDELAPTDSRIRVLHIEIADLATARNRGVAAATSEYVGFIDSDDYIAPGMYEALYENARKYDADLCFCNFSYDREGQIIPYSEETGEVHVMAPKDVVAAILSEKVSSCTWTKLFRRTMFDRWSFPEGRFYEDHAVIYRIAGDCRTCVHVDRSYYYYFQRADSICHTGTPIKKYHFFLADYDRIDYISKSPLFTEQEKDVMIARQVEICLWHMRSFMKIPGFAACRREMYEMRDKLLQICRSRKLSFRDRKSYLEIRYLWTEYLLRHIVALRMHR